MGAASTPVVLSEGDWTRLEAAAACYDRDTSWHYDEVLDEIADRVARTGSLGMPTSARSCCGSGCGRTRWR